jgi:hypothetical protein
MLKREIAGHFGCPAERAEKRAVRARQSCVELVVPKAIKELLASVRTLIAHFAAPWRKSIS